MVFRGCSAQIKISASSGLARSGFETLTSSASRTLCKLAVVGRRQDRTVMKQVIMKKGDFEDKERG